RVLKWDMQLAIRDRLEAGIGLLLCQTPGRVPALVRTRLGEARKAVRLAALPARGGSVELCAAALDRGLALLTRPADRRDSYRWHRDLLRELAGAFLVSPEDQRELALAQSRRAQGELEHLASQPDVKVAPTHRRTLLTRRREALAQVMQPRLGASLRSLHRLELLEERLDAESALADKAAERQAACRAILALLRPLEELAERRRDEDDGAVERALARSLRLKVEAILARNRPDGKKEAVALVKKRLALLEEAIRFLSTQSPRTT